jgi:hypothetical protein
MELRKPRRDRPATSPPGRKEIAHPFMGGLGAWNGDESRKGRKNRSLGKVGCQCSSVPDGTSFVVPRLRGREGWIIGEPSADRINAELRTEDTPALHCGAQVGIFEL